MTAKQVGKSKGLCSKYREVDTQRSLEAVKDRVGANPSVRGFNIPKTILNEKVS
jgi:hypothetical protein